MCRRAQVLEDEDLSDPMSITAKQFGTDRVRPYPFFLELQQWSSYTPSLTSSVASLQKNTKTVPGILDSTDDKRGSYSRSSRKNNRSETGFFNPSFRLRKKWPYESYALGET